MKTNIRMILYVLACGLALILWQLFLIPFVMYISACRGLAMVVRAT